MHRHASTSLWVALVFAACSSDQKGTGEGDSGPAINEEVFFPDASDDSSQGHVGSGDATAPDDSEVEEPDGETPSASCNTFGCACGSNSDCLDELCVEGPRWARVQQAVRDRVPERRVRVRADRPWRIGSLQRLRAAAPEPVQAVPRGQRVQERARAGRDALCLPAPDPTDGSFCASSAPAGRPARTATPARTCRSTAGGAAKQCVPTDGSCSAGRPGPR
jgi:hypothetical protein